jgi:N-methylhydantoinase A
VSRLVAVDVGGTFTDVVAVEHGETTRILTSKIATDLVASDTSVLAGAEAVGVEHASVFNLASTAGLNAVITRRLPKIGVLVTEGERDVLDGGNAARPVEFLTDPTWHRPFSDRARPLVPRYLRREVPELLDHHGAVHRPMDEDVVRRHLRVMRDCGVQGVAVCLDRSWMNPVHELRVLEIVREELGDIECCISSEVSPLSRTYPRLLSTVINTFMRILYLAYTERLERGLRNLDFGGAFNYADCRAMLVPAAHAMDRPYRLVAGGPAGGTVSSAHFGSTIGDGNIICVDVGGTSCDISVVLDGEPWVSSTSELEFDLEVNALSVDIITLGAGGGSIVAMSPTGAIEVGPESAGASPGPACYGKGGTAPATTDTALLMGIIDPDGFAGGAMKLDPALSLQAFEQLDTHMTLEQRVSYAWRIALNNIAEGIFNIAIRRGIDPREFSLMAFGAAGPMMLPSMLDLVPLRRVIVPPHPGLFSALGLLSSDQVFTEERSIACVLDEAGMATMESAFADMEATLMKRIDDPGDDVRVERSFDGRLQGQGWETPFVPAPASVGADGVEALCQAFHDVYEVRNGNRFPALPVEVVTLRVNVVVPATKVDYPTLASAEAATQDAVAGRPVPLRFVDGGETEAMGYDRSSLLAGQRLAGPAIVREATSTTFLPAGTEAVVGAFGELVIEQAPTRSES